VASLTRTLEVDQRTVRRRYAEHLADLGMPMQSVRGLYGAYRLGSAHKSHP